MLGGYDMCEQVAQPTRGKAPIDYVITEAGYAALAADPKTDLVRQPNWNPPMRRRTPRRRVSRALRTQTEQ